jgi:hypothetical protein
MFVLGLRAKSFEWWIFYSTWMTWNEPVPYIEVPRIREVSNRVTQSFIGTSHISPHTPNTLCNSAHNKRPWERINRPKIRLRRRHRRRLYRLGRRRNRIQRPSRQRPGRITSTTTSQFNSNSSSSSSRTPRRNCIRRPRGANTMPLINWRQNCPISLTKKVGNRWKTTDKRATTGKDPWYDDTNRTRLPFVWCCCCCCVHCLSYQDDSSLHTF